jgi:hypothetical protein
MSMIHPDQLKMLMTPQEIMEQYQPLDADRAFKQGPIARGGERTDRPRRTDMGYNDAMQTGYQRRKKDFQAEPVDDVWARKAQEARQSGLTESIHEHGVVHPVTLGDTIGLAGKPQVTGGHHRIAAAADAGGEQYIPVVHHEGLLQGAQAAMRMMGRQYR